MKLWSKPLLVCYGLSLLGLGYAQNVGIGTPTPTVKLEVIGDVGLRKGAAAFVGTLDAFQLQLCVHNQPGLILNPPPNWSIQRDLGGNPRGVEAIDLQRTRLIPSQVASGDYSTILSGASNTASGNYAVVAGGHDNQATHGSFVGGGEGNGQRVVVVL